MYTPELIVFIRKQLSLGISKEDLKKALIEQGGWLEKDIEAAFQEIDKPETSLEDNTPPEGEATINDSKETTPPMEPEAEVEVEVDSEEPTQNKPETPLATAEETTTQEPKTEIAKEEKTELPPVDTIQSTPAIPTDTPKDPIALVEPKADKTQKPLDTTPIITQTEPKEDPLMQMEKNINQTEPTTKEKPKHDPEATKNSMNFRPPSEDSNISSTAINNEQPTNNINPSTLTSPVESKPSKKRGSSILRTLLIIIILGALGYYLGPTLKSYADLFLFNNQPEATPEVVENIPAATDFPEIIEDEITSDAMMEDTFMEEEINEMLTPLTSEDEFILNSLLENNSIDLANIKGSQENGENLTPVYFTAGEQNNYDYIPYSIEGDQEGRTHLKVLLYHNQTPIIGQELRMVFDEFDNYLTMDPLSLESITYTQGVLDEDTIISLVENRTGQTGWKASPAFYYETTDEGSAIKSTYLLHDGLQSIVVNTDTGEFYSIGDVNPYIISQQFDL